MNNLEITNVSIYPIQNSENNLRAIVRIVLNDCLQLTNIRIYTGAASGLFVSYPIEFTQKGEEFRQIFYPTKKELRILIEDTILEKYRKEYHHE